MLGYLASALLSPSNRPELLRRPTDPRLGALMYNLTHTLTSPLLLAAYAV